MARESGQAGSNGVRCLRICSADGKQCARFASAPRRVCWVVTGMREDAGFSEYSRGTSTTVLKVFCFCVI